MLRTAAMFLSLVITTGTASAGWLQDAVNEAVENTGKRAVDDTAEDVYTGTREKTKEAITKDRSRDENAPSDTSGQAAEPNENSGAEKE